MKPMEVVDALNRLPLESTLHIKPSLLEEVVLHIKKGNSKKQGGIYMPVKMTIELNSPEAARAVVQALDQYKRQLRTGIERTRRKLEKFEIKYQVSTEHFLENTTSEDLQGGDMEYVEWAGEAKLLAGLESECEELELAS